MPITLPCPCGKTLRVKENLVGKRVKCPGCGAVVAVPAAAAAPAPPNAEAPDPERRAAESGPDAPVRRKKKRKKRARARTREEVDKEYARWLERSYWRKRIFRGSAFIGLGLIVIGGATYLLVWHPQDVQPLHSVLLLLIGVAGVLKGLVGLFFGRFFGEDE
jgi:hypothetical protein